MTPGVSAASELDPSLLMQSQVSVGHAAPSSATVTGGGLPVDPWASAAAQLPGHTPAAAACVPPFSPAPITFEQMKQLQAGTEDRLKGHINQQVGGLEERLTVRISAQDARIGTLETNDDKQDTEISALKVQVAKIEQLISTKMSSLSLGVQSRHDTDREAFLGGFGNLPKETLKRKAAEFVGTPTGFVAITCPGNVSNFVFIKFETAENVDTFILENRARAEASALRLKLNLPQGSPQDKLRRNSIWQGKQMLSHALGLPDNSERVVFSRRRFWTVAADGLSVVEMGTLDGDNKAMWNENAPENIKNTTSTFS